MNELTQPEETEKLVTVLRKEVKNEHYITLFLEIKIYVQVISSCCVSRFFLVLRLIIWLQLKRRRLSCSFHNSGS